MHRNIANLLPTQVVGRAKAMGERGQKWLWELDKLVSQLESAWNICVGEVLSGGSHALVALAKGSNGAQYVLKIDLPDDDGSEFLRTVQILRAADGRGYVKMYAFDVQRRAVLLERLGGVLRCSGFSPQEQMRILCRVLCETWQMPVRDIALPDGEASIAWFRSFIPSAWEELGRPSGENVICRAMEYLSARERALDPQKYVLLHGDAHNNNALEMPGRPGEYKLIDAEGLLYEREYDLGVLMREWPEEYEADPLNAAKERSRYLAALTGADEEGIWHWGFLQMVSTSFVLLQIGDCALGMRMLAIAQRWAA